MMTIYLIRHSITEGNRRKRYIGRTDEPLCTQGVKLLEGRTYPRVDKVYASPMKRCLQTAGIIYPDMRPLVIEELAECDFGLFENKNYQELSGYPYYQQWVDSNGTLPFPQGESKEAFTKRSLRGFDKVLEDMRETQKETAALIVHGGTIMSIMDAYACPKGSYFEFQVGNGEGYELVITNDLPGTDGICAGSDPGRSQMALSSGADDRTADYNIRKNYKKLPAQI